jgi:hypothetical protein
MPVSRILAAALSLNVMMAVHNSRRVIVVPPAASTASTVGECGSRLSRVTGIVRSRPNAPRSTCHNNAAASGSLKVDAIA